VLGILRSRIWPDFTTAPGCLKNLQFAGGSRYMA
jgi:hypothetical protein